MTDRTCIGVEQNQHGATAFFTETTSGRTLPPVGASAVIACDGINSVIRKQFCPGDEVAFAGINTWRGVTRRKPILTGATYMRIGSILTGKIVVYPIVDMPSTTRETSSSTGWPRSSATRSTRTTGTSPATSPTSIRSTRTGASIGSTSRR